MEIIFNDLNTLPQQVDENSRNVKAMSVIFNNNTVDIAQNKADIAQNKADIAQNKADIDDITRNIGGIGEWIPLSFTVGEGITAKVSVLYNPTLKLLNVELDSVGDIISQGTNIITINNFPNPSKKNYYNMLGNCVVNVDMPYRETCDFSLSVNGGTGTISFFLFGVPLFGSITRCDRGLLSKIIAI